MIEFEPDNTPGATLRRMLILLLAAVVMAFGIAARADSVRLYDQIGVEGPNVTLSQVAELKGDAAQAFAGMVLLTLDEGRDEQAITLAQVEKKLNEAGVNRGLVSLRGFNTCRVTRLVAPPVPVLDQGQAVSANIETPISLETTLTLQGMLEQQLIERAGIHADEIRINFTDRDLKRLDKPILGRSVEIEPISSNTLGRVPVVIRLYEGRTVAETFNVTAQLNRTLLAVVATGPIARGERFTRSHIQVSECVLDNDGVVPITDPSMVIGQESATALRTGDMVLVRSVRSPLMVKRGELVDVRCFVGGLIVRTVGHAMENGSLDDRILIRSESTGDTFYAMVTGKQSAVVSTDGSAEPEATTAMADQSNREVAR